MIPCAVDGGCTFALPPTVDATKTTVFWSPAADTSTVLLTTSPPFLSFDSGLLNASVLADGFASEHGIFFSHPLDEHELAHLFCLPGAATGQRLAALIPLDPDAHDRLQAVARFLRSLLGRSVPPDSRLTPQRRRRARHMLQAIDGRANGATYREIADVLFGKDRVAADPWKSSALRDATMDLVKDGLAMIAGGYRTLLRHRRRP